MTPNPYVLLEQVAVGGVCEIRRAKHLGGAGFEKVVAIKRLRPEYAGHRNQIQNLIDEAKLAAQLSHGNIAQVLGLVELGGHWCVVLEYVSGLDLARLTRIFAGRDLRLAVADAFHVVREVLVALDYLHYAQDDLGRPLGLVHGDMAPSNVMVTEAGEVKLVDFGTLRALDGPPPTGPVPGKVRYAPPESFQGGATSPRGDLYATGLILWELLAGVRVFEGSSFETLSAAVRSGTVPPVDAWRPELSPRITAIVTRALAAEPDRRFSSAADFMRAMGEADVPWDPARSRQALAALVRRLRSPEPGTPEPMPMTEEASLEDILNDELG